jgi:hypothetical protein
VKHGREPYPYIKHFEKEKDGRLNWELRKWVTLCEPMPKHVDRIKLVTNAK